MILPTNRHGCFSVNRKLTVKYEEFYIYFVHCLIELLQALEGHWYMKFIIHLPSDDFCWTKQSSVIFEHEESLVDLLGSQHSPPSIACYIIKL